LEEVLQELDDKLRVELQGEQEIREKQRELRSAIAKLRPEMERLNKEKLKIENSIEEIRKKAGVRDLEELRTKVTEKDKLQFQLNSSSQKLISLLGGDSSLWLEKLQELEVAPPGVKADAVRLKKLEDEISLLENEIRRYKENIQEVEEVEIKKRGFNTLAEVYQAESEKKAKLTQIDIRLEGAREATRILASISGNFNYYLQEAFSKGEDSVSAYFKEFTAGRYQEVVLIHPTTDPTPPEAYAIKVTANNGRVYSVEELSSGTRDQLLLATRIGLAQRLLPQPGFLVLDDAFLFSDVTREVILINALKKFQAKGWQIIYLTVSPHTKELFEEIWGIKAFLINQK
jgi:DNA repair exonuclease SbcCD ATPase subunit